MILSSKKETAERERADHTVCKDDKIFLGSGCITVVYMTASLLAQSTYHEQVFCNSLNDDDVKRMKYKLL